jgi:hypothetical protein
MGRTTIGGAMAIKNLVLNGPPQCPCGSESIRARDECLQPGNRPYDEYVTNGRYSRSIVQSRRSESGHCRTLCYEPGRNPFGSIWPVRWAKHE